jgi:hypothetical protein
MSVVTRRTRWLSIAALVACSPPACDARSEAGDDPRQGTFVVAADADSLVHWLEALPSYQPISEDAKQQLHAHLSHSNARVRRAAVLALPFAGLPANSAPTIDLAIALLGDSTSDVRAAASTALTQLGTASLSGLWSVLGHRDSTVRALAALSIGGMSLSVQQRQRLWARMRADPIASVREASYEAAFRRGSP